MCVRGAFVPVLFILLFIACERPKEIGFGLTPTEELGVFYADTISVATSTVLNDSIFTVNSNNILFGQYRDPFLGNVTAKAFFHFWRGQQSIDTLALLGNNEFLPIYDSLVLSLPTRYTYGKTNVTQTLNIFRITETLLDSVRYTNQANLQVAATPVKTTSIKADDLKRNPVLNVKLPDNLGQELFTLSGQSPAIKVEDFYKNLFKGLALFPETNDDAAVIGFDGIRLTLHYKVTQTRTEQPDTIVAKQLNFFLRRNFNQINSDKQGTTLVGIQPLKPVSSGLTGGNSFIQSGIGLQTKLDFPGLDNLKKLGNISINRAELIIKPLPGTFDQFAPPSSLAFYPTDQSSDIIGQFFGASFIPLILLQNGSPDFLTDPTSRPALAAPFDTRKEEYIAVITPFLRNVLRNNSTFPSLLISSVGESNSVNRLIIRNNSGAPVSVLSGIRLRIFYTVFN